MNFICNIDRVNHMFQCIPQALISKYEGIFNSSTMHWNVHISEFFFSVAHRLMLMGHMSIIQVARAAGIEPDSRLGAHPLGEPILAHRHAKP